MERMMFRNFSKLHRNMAPVGIAVVVAAFLMAFATNACVKQKTNSSSKPPAEKEEIAVKNAAAAGEKSILPSSLAGSWYPENRQVLEAEIEGYFAKVDLKPLDNVLALILPHAGYRYSGQTAAWGVRQLAGKRFSRVIVMGPTHRHAMHDLASLPGVTHYSTPLGEVPLDVEFMENLKKSRFFNTLDQVHESEHSVQIEIPLLQKALGDFKLVPIVVGQIEPETAQKMARELRKLMDKDTLVVVSSDFTHYGSRFGYTPFHDDEKEKIEKLDMRAGDLIIAGDLAGFANFLKETGATICGRCPIMILLAMLPESAKARLLRYDTSGSMTGDYKNSVSYASFAFTGKWENGESAKEEDASEEILSSKDKKQLLKLARRTLEHYLAHQEVPSPKELGVEITDSMKTVMGVFVTLKTQGRLRGCIGEIMPSRPLYQAVQAQAVNAGVRDRRFPPVKSGDTKDIKFEISALTPPKTLESWEDIMVGKHGVVLKKDGRQSVFLPQVAPEQGWDRDTMLNHLAQKAGLPADAWRKGASFDVFEAIVFHESGE